MIELAGAVGRPRACLPISKWRSSLDEEGWRALEERSADIPVDGFEAEIRWGDQNRVVTVLAMGRRPLLGTALLEGFNLTADFEDDGLLALTPL